MASFEKDMNFSGQSSAAPGPSAHTDALPRASSSLSSILDALPNLVFVVEEPSGKLSVNAQFRAATSVGVQELSATCWTSALAEEDRQEAESAWNEARRTGEPFEAEYRFHTADGDTRWFLCRATPVREDGQVVRWVGTCCDIDDRRRSETALSRSEAWFRSVFERSAAGIAHVATDGRFRAVNDGFCVLVGRTRDELLAKSFQDITHPDDLAEDEANVAALLSGTIDHYRMQKRYVRADGSIAEASLTVGMARLPDGSPEHFISVVEPIAVGQRAAEARFRTVFQSMFNFIGLLKLDGTLVDANESALLFGGVTAAEVLGCKFWDTPWWDIGEAGQEQLKAAIAQAAAGSFVRYEVAVRTADGLVPIDFTLKPVLGDDGQPVEIIAEGRDLTTIKAAEREARDKEEQLRLLVDAAGDTAIFRLDCDGRIASWNSGAVQILGCDAEDVLGQSYAMLFLPADQASGEPQRQLETARAHGSFEAEEWRARANGGCFLAQVRLTALMAADGSLRGYANVIRDVSAERAAQVRLADSREQLDKAIEQSPVGVALFDRNMRYLAASRNFAVQFGVPPEIDLVGRSHYDVFPDLPEKWKAAHQRVLDYGEELSADEDLYEREDGYCYWIRWAMGPWRKADESIGGMVIFGEDVTEQRNRRVALEEAEARFRAVFESAAVGMARISFDGESFLEVNDALCAITGYAREELLGRPWVTINHPDDVAEDLALFRRMAAGEIETYSVENRYIRKDGQVRWVGLTTSLVRSSDGRPDFEICVVEDIHERKADQRREAYRLQLTEGLRDLADPEAMMDAACALLGQQLEAAQVGFAITEEDEAHIVVRRDWNDGRIPSVSGRWKMDDFGPDFVRAMKAGQTIVIADVAEDARTNSLEVLAAYEAINTRAILDRALIRDGRKVGMLFIHHPEPRHWAPEEVALVEETTDRLWSALERAKAKAQLSESEARFRQIAENIREVFYVHDLDEERIVYVSPAYAEVWDRPIAELYGSLQAFIESIDPDDRHLVFAAMERQRQGEATTTEYRLRLNNGTIRHILDRAFPVRDTPNGARRVVGLAEDITLRHETEERHLLGAERLRVATEAADIGIWDYDPATDTLTWDDRMRELFGVLPGSAHQITYEGSFLRGLHPDDRDRIEAIAAAALNPAGSGRFEAEYRIVGLETGVERWAAAKGRAFFEDGRPRRFIGTVIDIEDRKRAEAALADSERRFRKFANTIPALMFVADTGGANTFVNDRYVGYAGCSFEELLGDGWLRTIHPDDTRRAATLWEASWRQSASYSAEYRFRSRDGNYRWHLVRGEPVRDAAGEAREWIGTATDIQELVEAREALLLSRHEVQQINTSLEARVAERTASLARANTRLKAEIKRREEAQSALIQAQKLEALGQLTSGVAHDFNNVIAAIAGGFSIISRRTDDPRILGIAEHGVKAAERGAELVKQLTTFARQQTLSPKSINLSALLGEAKPLLQRSIGAGVMLEVDCPADFRPVHVDPVLLETALINLAVNARDAMLNGGRLKIEVRTSAPDEGTRPAELPRVPAAAITISDTGSGIAPDVLQRVLEPFFTTKGPGKGTGLGLAMVHGFATQSGGGLQIESRLGLGTAITMYLPFADKPAESGDDDAGELVRAEPGTTLLLVDDDAEVRAITAAQLSDLGYTVIEADGADEGLRKLREHGNTIDLVVSDVVMPGKNGPAMVAEMRRARPHLPAMFVSGHAERGLIEGEALLAKPFTPAALAGAVADQLRERQIAGQEAAEIDRLLGRVKANCLRSFIADWRQDGGGAPLPLFARFNPAECEEPHKLVIAEVDHGFVPMHVRFAHVGQELEAAIGGALTGADLPMRTDDDLASWEASYRRCARTKRPVYEFARMDLGDGEVETFERLLLPWSTDGRVADRVVGIVIY